MSPVSGQYSLSCSGIVDAEKARLSKDLEGVKNIIFSIEKKLGNSAFTEKAPAQVVDGARRQLADNLSKKQETEDALNAYTDKIFQDSMF